MEIKLMQEWAQIRIVVKRPKARHDQGARSSRRCRIRKVLIEPVLESSA
jgi:hypothetical protein